MQSVSVGLGTATVLVALIASAPVTGTSPFERGESALVCGELEQQVRIRGGADNPVQRSYHLFDAAERGCISLVERFLDEGAHLEARDRFGNTPLLLAARKGHTELVRFLLARGAEIDHANVAGSTALLRAVDADRRRTAEVLLAAGADPNAVNTQGITPLITAAFNGDTVRHCFALEGG
jgi:ankyrin repeat protein